MKHPIKSAIDRIFHDSAIAELRLLNKGICNPTLTYNDILYLNIIEAHSGEYTASNLADMLFVSRPAVTQKVNELERKGYIYKEQSQSDKRVYKLFTDKAGTSKGYYDVVDQTDANITAALSARYTPEDIALFCSMTETICDIILDETKRGSK